MDRSLDSIGSCSLDVDADSSDISDTSGSLNFPTPLSVKDITREFTANIKERCTLRSPQQHQQLQHQQLHQQQQLPLPLQLQRTFTTTAYVNLDQRTGGVRMVLSPPATSDLVDVDSQDQQQQQQQLDSPSSTELSRKFKQLSPSKDYGEFRKKLQSNCTRSQSEQPVSKTNSSQAPIQNGDTDLPVFRHLSHEFRAQLPTVSPKRTVQRVANGADDDQVDYLKPANTEEYMSTTKIRTAGAGKDNGGEVQPSPAVSEESKTVVKDGNYFLKILKDEQIRLIALAAVAEKYIDALTNNPDITEDTFGLLRSAAGKARLLASQKMKQFEGLCHNNLNRSPEDAFPTTVDDLQGFWDMVYLQVTHVDSIFADIEKLKSNDWQHIAEPAEEVSTAPVKITKLNTKTGNAKAKGAGTGTAAALGPSNAVAAMKREAQRKQLLEMKRLRREQLAAAAKNQAACDEGANIGDTVNNTVKNSSDHSS
ncbi:PREDICTED: uncharacterized protein LOC108616325 isoform X2 [Drosophila arizonae]|uniref:Uncharacterized protein LOC108616325 isoform X2 n=1 Tax=Drosophila arizonae TaxID=7263 RepID=A0ABM1PI96_DROAR|nr:PREDICTED: uncharacterized protein LOC108616325 isoform X2 [Drosophila arizonae]